MRGIFPFNGIEDFSLMKQGLVKKIIILLGLILFIWSSPPTSAEHKPIAIIINKANSIDNINIHQLIRIYTGKEERWPSNSQKIVVINRPINSKIRRQFYSIVLNSKPTRKFFQLGSPIPFKMMLVKSDSATNKFIARIPNAIGYVYLNQVNSAVKVLKIDGTLPSMEGYKLNKKQIDLRTASPFGNHLGRRISGQ
jgi:phosphate transport system substrate-binding protein